MLSFNSDVLNLLQSAQPFLGSTGKVITGITCQVAELLNTEAGHKTMQAFAVLKPGAQASIMPLDADPSKINKDSPFALFLVLVLLILASSAGHLTHLSADINSDSQTELPADDIKIQ